MNETLVIYLHADDLTHPSWAIVDSERNVRQSGWRDSAIGLAQIAEDKKIIVVVPAIDILLLKTELPVMSHRRLLQAIPFALEDQLVEEVDTLHFAIRVDANVIHAAVVAHEKIQQWLSLLKSWQIKPDALFPASLISPNEKNVWYAKITDTVMVKTDKFSGFACDNNNFAKLMSLAIRENNHVVQQIILQNYTNANVQLDSDISYQEIRIPESQFIVDVAQNINEENIDLLQGRYAIKKTKVPQFTKLTKNIAYLITGWIALLFLYPLVSYLLLFQHESAIDTQIKSIYFAHFPQATNIVAPQIRLQEKLQKLQTGGNGSKAFALIAYAGKGFSQSTSIKLKRLDFQNNQLKLDINAPNSDDIAMFSEYLTKHGLSVKQQNANLALGRVNATLLV